MNRSKLSLRAIVLLSGIGLAAAALGGSHPAAAQSYSDDYSCPAGYVYDPSSGCTLSGCAYEAYDYARCVRRERGVKRAVDDREQLPIGLYARNG